MDDYNKLRQRNERWLAKGQSNTRHTSSGAKILSGGLKKYYYQLRGIEKHIRYNRVVDERTEQLRYFYAETIDSEGNVIDVHPKIPEDLGHILPSDWDIYPLLSGD